MASLILFDLDGTLTESHPGIIRSIRYALDAMGYPHPADEVLRLFVGPPLAESFAGYLHMPEQDIPEAIRLYREYFSSRGKYENSVYDGIPAMLESLSRSGYRLGTASSKPEAFVRDILAYFQLADYFSLICGASMDGTRSEKPDVIRYVLQEAGSGQADAETLRREVVMVGDRRYDVTGAHEMGLSAIGVTWGYGSREELTESGADALAADPEELYRILTGNCTKKL